MYLAVRVLFSAGMYCLLTQTLLSYRDVQAMCGRTRVSAVQPDGFKVNV